MRTQIDEHRTEIGRDAERAEICGCSATVEVRAYVTWRVTLDGLTAEQAADPADYVAAMSERELVGLLSEASEIRSIEEAYADATL